MATKKKFSVARSRKFTASQINLMLQWLAEGLNTAEASERAKQENPSFTFTKQEYCYYKGSRRIDIMQLRTDMEEAAISEGLALRSNRIKVIDRLAKRLLADLEDDLWIERVRSILATGGVLTEKEFKASIVKEFRGLLDDIAKETGGRSPKLSFNAPSNSTIKVSFTTGSDTAEENEDDSDN